MKHRKVGIFHAGRLSIGLSLLVCLALLVQAGCSKNSSPAEPEAVDLMSFVTSVNPFPPPAPEFDRQNGAAGDTTIAGGGGVQVCTVERFEMGRNMHEIVAFDPNAGALWPGCIVQGKYVCDGILAPVSAMRSACVVGISGLPGLTQEQLSRTIDDPTQFAVAGALNSIVDDFLGSGKTKDAEFTFTRHETHEFEQGMLDIGICAEWAAGDLRSRFGYSWQSERNTLLLKFTQKYYTATVDPPASPVGYFDPSVTVDDLKPYTGNGNPLCYVKSVTYGRIGILEMTSSRSASEMSGAVDLAFTDIRGSGEIDINATYAQVLRESEMKLLVLGGQGSDVVVNLANPIDGLNQWIQSGIMLTPQTQGVPISYTIAHMKDNSVARFQYATEFTRRTCAWADQPVYLSVYKMKCEGEEGGLTPALEGWCEVWLTTEMPGLPTPVQKYAKITFGDFDKNETRDITNASWFNPMPRQAGAKFTLRVKITEDDDWPSDDDNMGDRSWLCEYPAFNPGSGTCAGDPPRCLFEQVYESGNQKIRLYWKLNLDGTP